MGCRALTSVVIPNSITRIPNYAFNKCVCLKDVSIPGSVTHIGEGAFSYCKSLTSVGMSIVNAIDEYAFECSGLADVTISEGMPINNLGVLIKIKSLKKVIELTAKPFYSKDELSTTLREKCIKIQMIKRCLAVCQAECQAECHQNNQLVLVLKTLINYLPVLPKPPSPLSVLSSSSTNSTRGVLICSKIN